MKNSVSKKRKLFDRKRLEQLAKKSLKPYLCNIDSMKAENLDFYGKKEVLR